MLEFILRPWHLIVLFVASQLNREQQRAIEYLHAENQVLWEKLLDRYLLRIPGDLRGRLKQMPGLTEGELRALTKMDVRRQRAAVGRMPGLTTVARAG